jgi:hypothetical protein
LQRRFFPRVAVVELHQLAGAVDEHQHTALERKRIDEIQILQRIDNAVTTLDVLVLKKVVVIARTWQQI